MPAPIEKSSLSPESDSDIRAAIMATNPSKSPVDDDPEKDIKEAPKAQRDVIVGVSDAYLQYSEGKLLRCCFANMPRPVLSGPLL
ncbi:unnamed protein product [Schistocephalus solidus]|uniref:Autophagy-related protein n=1 Tax=Schistocephalus solidus TaxID=70667 RepID=A0A183TIY0_SCHSO|nr:unnamed protein product [Schistocephalus solidus]